MSQPLTLSAFRVRKSPINRDEDPVVKLLACFTAIAGFTTKRLVK